jgi:hypothetical protein
LNEDVFELVDERREVVEAVSRDAITRMSLLARRCCAISARSSGLKVLIE